jgi:hypothetical protein
MSYQIKIPEPGTGYFVLSCWLMRYYRPHPWLPQTLQAIASILGYPLEFQSKTLLLKTPHRELSQYWPGSYSHSWLAFTVLEGAVHAGRWGKRNQSDQIQLRALWATETAGLVKHDPWCNSGTIVMGETNHSLLGVKSRFTRHNSYAAELWS